MKVGKIAHVCIITADIVEAAKRYTKLLCIKHWYQLVRTGDLDMTYHGEKRNSDVTIWLGGKGNTKIELIQSRGDDNIYSNFLSRHGESLHHLQYYVKDLNKAIEDARSNGLQLLLKASFMSKGMRIDYAYVGENEDAVAFELIEATLPFGIKKGDMPCETILGILTGNMKKVM